VRNDARLSGLVHESIQQSAAMCGDTRVIAMIRGDVRWFMVMYDDSTPMMCEDV
jgi:hypothetical protein